AWLRTIRRQPKTMQRRGSARSTAVTRCGSTCSLLLHRDRRRDSVGAVRRHPVDPFHRQDGKEPGEGGLGSLVEIRAVRVEPVPTPGRDGREPAGGGPGSRVGFGAVGGGPARPAAVRGSDGRGPGAVVSENQPRKARARSAQTFEPVAVNASAQASVSAMTSI